MSIQLRKARIPDARGIHQLLLSYARDGIVLPRSLAEIYESIREFFVVEDAGRVVGICSLTICWDNLAEVRSLAVLPDRIRQGVGRDLVQACLAEAATLGIARVFALTYQPGFFRKLGFVDIEKSELPQKVWGDCMRCAKFPDCDEWAVVIDVALMQG